jgi:hypothetical protein
MAETELEAHILYIGALLQHGHSAEELLEAQTVRDELRERVPFAFLIRKFEEVATTTGTDRALQEILARQYVRMIISRTNALFQVIRTGHMQELSLATMERMLTMLDQVGGFMYRHADLLGPRAVPMYEDRRARFMALLQTKRDLSQHVFLSAGHASLIGRTLPANILREISESLSQPTARY